MINRTLFGQRATIWRKTNTDGYGIGVFSVPEFLDVRWEQRHDMYKMMNMTDKVSRGIVYVGESDQTIKLGDFLFLGESSDTNPLLLDDSYEVQSVSIIYNLFYDRYIVKVFL